MSRSLFNERKTFWDSVLRLVGHLFGSGFLFIAFYSIGWLVSVIISKLESAHSMPGEIQIFIQKAELWWVYADAALCVIVIGVGAYTFVRELGD